MELSAKQLKIIEAKPYLSVYFETGTESNPFRLETARNEEAIIAHQEIESTGNPQPIRYLSSKYNPGQEASRVLSTLGPLSGHELVLVLGLGNPLILGQILPLLSPNQICIAVDAHMSLGRLLAQDYVALEDFLTRPGCHLFCGDMVEQALWTYLEAIPMEGATGVRVMSHSASQRLASEFYEEIEARVQKHIQARMSDLMTRMEFEKNWIKNIIINSEELAPRTQAEHPEGIAHWKNALEGVPGVLVAAGPSLRKSLPVLRELSKKAFILVCDTAYKVPSSVGIPVHAVLTLDAQKHTFFHFQGARGLEDIILFADLVTHPLILRNVPARSTVYSTTARYGIKADGTPLREVTPGSEHAEILSSPTGDIQSGGSVATSGFELLRYLGVSEVILIGQDLAYTGREIHSTGTHHNERWLTNISRVKSLEHINEAVVRKRHTENVPALDGGTVLSDYVLNLYRHWFEESIPVSGQRTVNLTGAGARIKGVEEPPDPAAYASALPDQPNIMERFAGVRKRKNQKHELNRQLTRELATIKTNWETYRKEGGRPGAALAEIDAFLEHWPYLKILKKHTEIYIRRNRHKLDTERADKLLEESTVKAFLDLYRGIKAYFRT